MPAIGPFELVVIFLYGLVVLAVIALPVFVLREMRRRGNQLDRIERRLNELDGRGAPRDRG